MFNFHNFAFKSTNQINKYKINKMNRIKLLLTAFFISTLFISGCNNGQKENTDKEVLVRQVVDTVGFAQYDWQMDSIMAKIEREQGKKLNEKLSYSGINDVGWKVVVSPHDDYAYVGYMYPAILKNIKAKTIILIGVAHKAKKLNLEDLLIFDSYDYWKGPYGNVKVSGIRNEIMKHLPKDIYQVNDTMQKIEHSVEAIIPFLQYYNRDVEIVSILVPYMSFNTMEKIAGPLAKAINTVAKNKNWEWGNDFAMVISNDAVHYGDEGWGGENFAFFGTGCKANESAKLYDYDIMKTISGPYNPDKIKEFTEFTVEENDFRKYKWTWCGRYSVPLGLLTAYKLNEQMGGELLFGTAVGYSNSIDHPELEVEDIGMGTTAPAYDNHWVGYAGIGYK
ncbi:MAG: AmmeMemoRadiSam system protein B [Bacteroidetes bacterium]|nr:MAG: AmmeMemoRadiSam system protein B [Bacteroidota bacterium]